MLWKLRNNRQFLYAIAFGLLAIALRLAGQFIQEPGTHSFSKGIARPTDSLIGVSNYNEKGLMPDTLVVAQTKPLIIVPGDNVQLTLFQGKESLLGMWKCIYLRVDPLPVSTIGHIDNVTTIPENETWDTSKNQDHFTGPGVPLKFVAEERPFAPWIRFSIPNDPNFKNKNLWFRIHMQILYPKLSSFSGWEFNNYELTIHKIAMIHVASDAQSAGHRLWRILNILRNTLSIVFGLLSIGLMIAVFWHVLTGIQINESLKR